MKIKFIIGVIVLLICIHAKGQDVEDDYEIVPDTVIVHDTIKTYISSLDDITRTFGMTFDEFAKEFLLQKEKKDFTGKYASETVYLNYLLPMCQNERDFSGKRMVSDVFSFHIDREATIETLKLPDSVQIRNYDVLFQCGSSIFIDYFLSSPYLMDKALVELFGYIDAVNDSCKKVKGINFDFSGFQFHEKRKMLQFARSVSLVIDSMHLKSTQNLSLYFSFDKILGEENRTYLYALSGMGDSVFLVENNDLKPVTVITKEEASNLSLYQKIANQFYLYRFYTKEFPSFTASEFSVDQMLKIAHADYPDNNWESYFFIFAGLFILLATVLILYWTIPVFSYYLNKNRDYLFVLILMSFFEMVMLLLAMTEAMSREDILNLSNENKNLLLFLPLIFVFVIPVFKLIGQGKKKP